MAIFAFPDKVAWMQAHNENIATDDAANAKIAADPIADTVAAPAKSPASSSLELAPTLGAQSIESNLRHEGAASIGRFLVLRKLGEGGMGEVFSGYDEQLDRKVAIKLLHAAYAPEETQKRMLREAQALARLSHPHVVTVHEVGQVNGDVFVIMEHIDGKTLRDWQDESARSVDEILRAYLMAGRGLAAVHAAGMVHRDFKPHNAMIDQHGRVRILDFGLAHARGVAGPAVANAEMPSSALSAQLTEDGAIAGTPAYMSPEQFTGEALDARTDQFSFCVALYEALFKELPKAADSGSAVPFPGLAVSLAKPPTRDDISSRIANALMRGLSWDKEARFPDMNALLEELEIAPHADPSGQMRQRVGFFLVVCATLVAWGFVPAPADKESALLQFMFMASLTTCAIGAAATYFFRNTLLRNPFHRQRIVVVLVLGMMYVLSRAASLVLHEHVETLVLRETFICATGIAISMIFLVPRVVTSWLALALVLLGAVFLIIFPAQFGFVANVVTNGTILLYFIAWHRSSKIAPATGSKERNSNGTTSQTSSVQSTPSQN